MSDQERCAACGSARFVRIRIGGPDGFLRAQCVPCGRIRQPLATWSQKTAVQDHENGVAS